MFILQYRALLIPSETSSVTVLISQNSQNYAQNQKFIYFWQKENFKYLILMEEFSIANSHLLRLNFM